MDARIKQLVGGRTGELVAGDVPNAVSAGLDSVHPHLGQFGKDVRGFFQLNPVELDILAGRKMPITTIVDARNLGKPAQLSGAQHAIRNGDAQHIGVEL